MVYSSIGQVYPRPWVGLTTCSVYDLNRECVRRHFLTKNEYKLCDNLPCMYFRIECGIWSSLIEA
jgi:hypothetical protein